LQRSTAQDGRDGNDVHDKAQGTGFTTPPLHRSACALAHESPEAAAHEGIQLSALSDYDLSGDGPQGPMFGHAAAPE
jgi:hypothetical protein